MKGSLHVAIGASAPIGLVVTQHATIFQGAAMAAVSAGYSLLPDVDNRKATANVALGGSVHKFVHSLCARVYQATGTRRDRAFAVWAAKRGWDDPYHRTLTHTFAAAALLGVLVYTLSAMSAVATGFIAAFGVFLMWPLHRGAVGPVVGVAVAASLGSAVLLDPWLMTLAATGGYVSHIVADACTRHGVPAFWPVPIKGKRWWNIRLLDSLVTSGSAQEKGPAVGVSLTANVFLVFLQF